MNKLLVLAATAVLLAGCGPHPRKPTVTVINQSSATLTNIAVYGSTFSPAFTPLAPGAHETVNLDGEPSEIKIEFDANGKHFTNLSGKIQWVDFQGVDLIVPADFNAQYGFLTRF